MDAPVLAVQQGLTYISLDDPPRVMDDRDGWRENQGNLRCQRDLMMIMMMIVAC